ncbi:MAG: Glycosyl transferase family 2 [Candidatus Pacebacteria bacterium GW2011_GWB1_47_8]|nr:MAG: Glycosyl transferase family 2 [Candidatus Pacebacteria bacterium GW2011_GWA1_46_10]KKU84388.1 MAG: Glycosyl transferase family 2 [Candidatus Pacebacteria bacterium GW2011_GWB1_47_8]HCR81185.1 glycosyltransferase [Candidatus Paceibacterota bacterium]
MVVSGKNLFVSARSTTPKRSKEMDFFIVTPSFNQRRFLQQTIDSVLRQKGDFTVTYWVFDGGSTDDSQTLLKKYNRRLRWQSKKDKGQTAAINKGIKQLRVWLKKTKKNPDEVIFAYLNSDDYYLPGVFQLVAKLFARTHQTWLVGDCLIVNERGRVIQSWVRKYKQFWRFWLSPSLLGVLNPIPQPGVFIKASQMLKIGLFDESLRYVMDYDYWFRLFAQSGRPIITSRALAAFRIHSQSKGGSQFRRQFAEQQQVAKKYLANSFLLGLQVIHNMLINFLYQMMKTNL